MEGKREVRAADTSNLLFVYAIGVISLTVSNLSELLFQVEEMAQWVRALSALPEVCGSIPSTHNCLQIQSLGIQLIQIYIEAKHQCTQNKNMICGKLLLQSMIIND